MIRMRSNEDAMEMLDKAKSLIESACEMFKNGMDYRNQMRDSRGRYANRDWDREERMMRRDGDWDNDMPRSRYGY